MRVLCVYFICVFLFLSVYLPIYLSYVPVCAYLRACVILWFLRDIQ